MPALSAIILPFGKGLFRIFAHIGPAAFEIKEQAIPDVSSEGLLVPAFYFFFVWSATDCIALLMASGSPR